MLELGLLQKVNEQLRIRVMQLEAKVIELTDLCLDWRDHHDYIVELRANVERVCGELDPEALEWEPIE